MLLRRRKAAKQGLGALKPSTAQAAVIVTVTQTAQDNPEMKIIGQEVPRELFKRLCEKDAGMLETAAATPFLV